MQNNPAYGLERAIGFGWESTYGTAVSPSVWWPSVSCGLVPGDPPLPHAGPTGKITRFTYNATRPRFFRGTPANSGPTVVEAEYDDIGVLLSNAIAAPASVNNTGTNNGYEHVFSLPATPTALTNSFTLINYTPDNGELTPPHTYDFAGCMIDSLEISSSGGQIARVALDIVAQSFTMDEGSHSPSFSATQWIEHHHTYVRYESVVGTQPDSSDNLSGGEAVADWTFRIENGLRRQQAAGNGVRGWREPIPEGYRTATLAFNRDWFNHTFQDLLHSATDPGAFGSFSVFADSGTDIDTGGQNYDLEIWFPAGIVLGDDPTHGGGPDIMGESIMVEAAHGGSGDIICQATLHNNTTNAAGVAYKGSQT